MDFFCSCEENWILNYGYSAALAMDCSCHYVITEENVGWKILARSWDASLKDSYFLLLKCTCILWFYSMILWTSQRFSACNSIQFLGFLCLFLNNKHNDRTVSSNCVFCRPAWNASHRTADTPDGARRDFLIPSTIGRLQVSAGPGDG